MGGWYWIGLALGLGVGVGTAATAVLGSFGGTPLLALATPLAAAAGLGVGLAVGDWAEAIAGAAGGGLGAASLFPVLRGALRSGGTPLGLALLLGGAGVLLGALALVPALGYVEAGLAPALALRLRQRAAERYAGLRILARD